LSFGDLAWITFFLGAPTTLLSWSVVIGLRTGRLPVRNGRLLRAEQPIQFWIGIALYSLFLAVLMVMIFEVLREVITSR